jgi:hypothetical protein
MTQIPYGKELVDVCGDKGEEIEGFCGDFLVFAGKVFRMGQFDEGLIPPAGLKNPAISDASSSAAHPSRGFGEFNINFTSPR